MARKEIGIKNPLTKLSNEIARARGPGGGNRFTRDLARTKIIGPLIGNTSPIHDYYDAVKHDLGSEPSSVPLGFHENTTLALSGLIDAWLWKVGGNGWRTERENIFANIAAGITNITGTVDYETFVVARSSLGPKILGALNNHVLGDEQLPIKSDINPLSLWEHNGIPKGQKTAQYVKDGLTGIAAALALAGIDMGVLLSLPSQVQEVLNPALLVEIAKGGGIGAGAGTLLGALVRGAMIDKYEGTQIGIGIAAGSTVAGAAIAGAISHEATTVEKQMSPANIAEWGWTAPGLGLVAFGLVGVSQMLKHKKGFQAIKRMMREIQSDPEKSKGWRSMLAILVDGLNYQQRIGRMMKAKKDGHTTRDVIKASQFYRDLGIGGKLFDAVRLLRNRNQNTIEAIQKLTPERLGDLSAFLMQSEMLAWEYPAPRVDSSEKPIKGSVVDFVPKAYDLFDNLDVEMLSVIREGTTQLMKSLKEKDPIAGLSIIFPSVSLLALGAGISMGRKDDAEHYGPLGMNTATRGIFSIIAYKAMQDAAIAYSPDTLRGTLWSKQNLEDISAKYLISMPIGALDRINRPPVQESLLQLYSMAYALAGETSPERGGTKGFHSDVGETIIKAMDKDKGGNPLFGYIALADLSNAIKWAPTLLVNLPKADARKIAESLKQLRHSLVQRIVNKHFPTDKQGARKVLTDDDTAREAYTALEMLVEACGDDIIKDVVGNRIGEIVSVSGVRGDPLIYSEMLPLWVFNLDREAIHSPFLGREMANDARKVVAGITREYIQRIGIGGTTGIKDDKVKTINDFLRMSLQSNSFTAPEVAVLSADIETMLKSWDSVINARFASLVLDVKAGPTENNISDKNRINILITLAMELDPERFLPIITEISKKMEAISSRVASGTFWLADPDAK